MSIIYHSITNCHHLRSFMEYALIISQCPRGSSVGLALLGSLLRFPQSCDQRSASSSFIWSSIGEQSTSRSLGLEQNSFPCVCMTSVLAFGRAFTWRPPSGLTGHPPFLVVSRSSWSCRLLNMAAYVTSQQREPLTSSPFLQSVQLTYPASLS